MKDIKKVSILYEILFDLEPDLQKSDFTYCSKCDEELEIVSLSPSMASQSQKLVSSDDLMSYGDDSYQ